MAENEVVVRDIQWSRLLSVGQVTRAFRIAIWPPSKLFLCLLALAATIGAGMLLDLAFKTDVNNMSFADNMKNVYCAAASQDRGFQTYAGAPGEWIRLSDPRGDVTPVYRGMPGGPVGGMTALLVLICNYWQAAPWFAVLNTLIAVLVWTFFGGAVCRMAAVQFARDERIGMGQALRFACQRYASLVASPLAMFVVIALIAVPTFFVAGAVMLIPYGGEVVVGLLFFLALGVGVVLALLALFGLAGLGLQMPAIASEGRDAFDAISRSVGYVFNRPWKYILYSLFSLLYMCLTFLLVRFFAFLVLKIPYLFLKTTWPGPRTDGVPDKLAQIWSEPSFGNLFTMPDSGGALHFAAVVIGVYVVILLGLMIAFIPSFLLSSQTIIYFLLRRIVDFKDLDEVYLEEEEEKESGLARLEKTESTEVEPEPPTEGGPAEGQPPASS